MQITSLRVRDFRNYTDYELTPHPGINLLFGQNGSGKTNLLEAIHYCALGRSHRTAMDREVVRRGCEMGACGVKIASSLGQSEVTVKLTPGGQRTRQVFIDRKKAPRLSDLMGKLRVVIFSPEDLLLVREGPSVRRRFLDMMSSQLTPGCFVALQQYQQALTERNALLKESRRLGIAPDAAMCDAFELAMAAQAAVIIRTRRRLTGLLSPLAAEKYSAISGRETERFAAVYMSCVGNDVPEDQLEDTVLQRLKATRREDSFRGSTSFGPHHEELELTLNDRPMKLFASQGQQRTAALALKLSQLALFTQETGESPVLLLDDVMSELDMTRRTHLLQEIGGVQTFVTCTDESDLEGCGLHRSYRVSLSENLTAQVSVSTEGESVPVADDVMEEPDFS